MVFDDGETLANAHKENNQKSRQIRANSCRAQLRRNEKTIQRLKLKYENALLLNIFERQKIAQLEKDLKVALELTPSEKSQLAQERIQRTLELNEKICEIGACIHEEHWKK